VTTFDHEELVQRGLDGDLTPDERGRLETLLGSNQQAAGFDRRLQTVRESLERTGPAEPPPGFTATVMRRVVEADARFSIWQRWHRRFRTVWNSRLPHGRRDTSERGWLAAARGGHMRTRQILWAVGGAAAVVVVVGLFTGGPRIDQGSEGTVGAAARYRVQQLDGKDVVLGDSDIQQFLQSDTFDRLVRDERTRNLLSNAQLRTALASAEFRAVLANPALASALADADLRAALTDAAFWQALKAAEEKKRNEGQLTGGSDAGYIFKPIDKMTPKLSLVLADAGFWQALKAAQQKKLESQLGGGGSAAELDANLRMLTVRREAAEEAKALAQGINKLQEALADPNLQAAIASPALRQSFADPALAAALSSADFASALQNQAFQSALREPAFAAALQGGKWLEYTNLNTSRSN